MVTAMHSRSMTWVHFLVVQEEYEAAMLPRHGKGQGLRSSARHSAELPYERKVGCLMAGCVTRKMFCLQACKEWAALRSIRALCASCQRKQSCCCTFRFICQMLCAPCRSLGNLIKP